MKTKLPFFALIIMLALLVGSCAPAPTPDVTVTFKVTVTFTPVPTETPIPTATQIALNISSEVQQALADSKALNPDGSIINKLAHSENAQSISIAPESIMVLPSNNTAVNELIAGKGKDDLRYLWNTEIGAWTPERHFTMEYKTAEVVKLDEVYDGSLRLSALLQYAEHPEIIPPGAIDPHYKITVGINAIIIDRYRMTQYLWPDAKDPTQETILKKEDVATKRSWGWLGLIRILDPDSNVIVVMSDILKNPVAGDPKNVLPRFTGFDKEYFLGDFSIINGYGLTGWETIMQIDSQQIAIMYPFPEGDWINREGFGDNWRLQFGVTLPHVAKLLINKSIVKMFPYEIQNAINGCYNNYMGAANKSDTPELPFSTPAESLPNDLSIVITFPFFDGTSSP